MAVNKLDNQCGFFARFSFRAANKLIDMQAQGGKTYPTKMPLKMLQYSADNGHVSAMTQLGNLLCDCGVGQVDKRSGLEYVRNAAKEGDAEAQFRLGELYLTGNLVQQDLQRACHWLAQAADRGHADATPMLNQCRQQLGL